MINIRNFSEEDLEQIQSFDNFMWLCLKWNQTYHKEDAFVAVDENKNIIGVVALSYDGTWYYLNKNVTNVPVYKLHLNLSLDDKFENLSDLYDKLVEKAKKHLDNYRKQYPDKNLALAYWVEDKDLEQMQSLLKHKFYIDDTVLVMSYDLSKDIPEKADLGNVKVGIHNFDEEGMKSYLEANAAAHDGIIEDTAEELYFRFGDDNTKVFTAMDGNKVVSSCMVWKIDDDRWATENVFTIPDYRKRGIARETLYTALRYIKEQNVKIGTLTTSGKNTRAQLLYLSMGYNLYYNMFELHY